MKKLLHIADLTWIAAHAAVNLVMIGAMLAWFGVGGMVFWVLLGWLTLLPTLYAPQWVPALYRRFKQHENTVRENVVEEEDTNTATQGVKTEPRHISG